jgi:molybdopterin-guanine dinucleotide biosynthesis protein A
VPELAEGRLANVAGAVLLGGAARRMGRDKARIALGGVALATRVARVLAGICEELLLVGGDPPAEAPGRRVADPEGPACGLRGLVGALAAASAERVLVVAADLPLVRPELLLALVAWPGADAVVPRPREGSQPLCALYRREPVLRVARERLAAGALALQGLVAAVAASFLEPEDLAPLDPRGAALLNVNTPEDLARAEALLRVAQEE